MLHSQALIRRPLQNGGELSVLFRWSLFPPSFTGSGALGVDRLLTGRPSPAAGDEATADQAPVPA
jgi:putative oxidoreductase